MFQEGDKVRIVLRRKRPHSPATMMRGEVIKCSDSMIKISGRRFTRVKDARGGEPEERPLDSENKVYGIPMFSVRFIELIIIGTLEERLHSKVQRAPILKQAPDEMLDE